MSGVVDVVVEAVTPAQLIGQVRDARERREQADRDVLSLAVLWAQAHEVHGPVRLASVGGALPGTGDFPDPVSAVGAVDAARGEAGSVWEVEEAEDRGQWRGLPELVWDAAAPFATALGLTPRGGRTVLRQGLTLWHRMPRTQARWEAGGLATRAAKQVADAVAGQPDDVCAWVDHQVADRLARHGVVGPVVLDRLIAAAMAELHAEQVELDRQEQLGARYARVTPSAASPDGAAGPDRYGLAEFVIRGQWPDVKAFNDTVAALAEVLRTGEGPEAGESVEVRRSVAVGILADPVRAAHLLGLHPDPNSNPNPNPDPDPNPDPAEPEPSQAGTPVPVRRLQKILLTFHLAADAVAGVGGTAGFLKAGMAPVGVDDDGRPWLDGVVREWAGRPDVSVSVRPVVHCGGCADCATYCEDRHRRQSYRPTDLDLERVGLVSPRCVFPYCTMPARRCDCDHMIAFDPDHPDHPDHPDQGGPTCPRCNLAPLCRHHHRLKTHAGWSYRRVEPGVHAWTEPHGQTFVTTPSGTRDTTSQPPSRLGCDHDRDGP